MNKKNDVHLWKRISKGDMNAYNILYDENVDFLYILGMQYYQDKDFVKDCIHDLFLDIYKYKKNLYKVRNTRQYLITSFKRKLFNQQNKELKNDSDVNLMVIVSEENSMEEIIIGREEKSYNALVLASALSNLSENQRSCLFMRFNEGKEYTEIARVLNISVESVRTKLYRAIKTLRSELKK